MFEVSSSIEISLMLHKEDWKFRNGNIRLANFDCQSSPILGKKRDKTNHKQNSGAALCFIRLMKFPKNDKNHPILNFCYGTIRRIKNFIMLPIGLQILVVKVALYTTIALNY